MASDSKTPAMSLFNNPTLSDIKIKQTYNDKTREYHAHKSVLCLHSTYFLKAFTGNYREASDAEMEVHDDDPESFELALKFIYSAKYQSIRKEINGDKDKNRIDVLCSIIKLYIVADKYHITSLLKESVLHLQVVWASKALTKIAPRMVIKPMVEEYYMQCGAPGSRMGKAITSSILKYYRRGTGSQLFGKMLVEHPMFSADIALTSSRKHLLSFKVMVCRLASCHFRVAVEDEDAVVQTLECPYCQTKGLKPGLDPDPDSDSGAEDKNESD
ncbi:hypothetical protein P154DRAFT_563001 [Amniculicola lignicola CBS 123094]|uniref:BTB domain-containing protein n=1 Tax=Amniculicola lignicola CBS 123094 TaxID=1392246 RepID=A0A6A5WFZ6_9PLEO|nr:hypothetical protein P154DRAFT_563001 [Amniculicola lignicola CBS 123094]